MSTKNDLTEARNELLAVLDEKFAKVPEWRAFRAIDKALSGSNSAPAPARRRRESPRIDVTAKDGSVKSYGDLAVDAFDSTGKPVTTSEMVEFIGARRKLGKNPKKARINIQSGLSRDKRIHSIPWRGGRAWWHVGRPAPKNESAGSSANP